MSAILVNSVNDVIFEHIPYNRREVLAYHMPKACPYTQKSLQYSCQGVMPIDSTGRATNALT